MKRRLAYFSPLPPARTGIADYSAELLPYLARLADVTLFSDEQSQFVDPGLAGVPVYPVGEYARHHWLYDLAIYQIGNSGYHEAIGRTLLRYPGVMVLHDYGLHQLWAGQTVAKGDAGRYAREMAYELGLSGIAWAADAVAGRRPLPHFEVPLNKRFVNTALGVIVHSRYVESLLLSRNPQERVAVVPAPIALGQAPTLRSQLGLSPDACLFGSFGVVSHTKQLEAALVAFRAVRANNPQCHYLIVGPWQAHDVDVPALVNQLGLQDAVRYTGHLGSLEEFLGWLAAVDIVVNLRYPTVGETSAVALRCLAAGRVLVVYDHGWYAELPGDTCLKLPPLDQEALNAALQRLAEDETLRTSLGQRGQSYVREHHSLQGAASAYLAFVEAVLASSGGSGT
jgi:glycosyltransferase involved in cell wall biosynthesis